MFVIIAVSLLTLLESSIYIALADLPMNDLVATARAGGEVDLTHGEHIFLTPQPEPLHKFNNEGLSVS